MPPTTAPPTDHLRVLGLTDPKVASDADRALTDLADRQHGVVARRQLVALGVSDTMVRDRVRRGLLRRIHRGVYAVGHGRLRRAGHWLAAVLAAGRGAVLSHRDAAALHGIRHPHDGRIEVTTRSRFASTRLLHVHATTVLAAEDVTTVDGIPVTSVARTLVDLASVVQPHQLAKALNEAERVLRVDVREIDRALARTSHRPGRGHAAMRAALAEVAAHGTQLTRFDLEARFAALLIAHDMPRPHHNAQVHGYEATPTGRRSGWSSNWTATSSTTHARRSSAIATRTTNWSWPATACCASPTTTSSAARPGPPPPSAAHSPDHLRVPGPTDPELASETRRRSPQPPAGGMSR